jgi:hypothetical protein
MVFFVLGRIWQRPVGEDGEWRLRVFFSSPTGYERFLINRFNR